MLISRRLVFAAGFALLSAGTGCGDGIDGSRFFTGSERREACREHDPLRAPYFGDLHVHTALSFDAAGNGLRTTPRDAYRFALGETIDLPPYDANGNASRSVTIGRPLDFAAVTDHAEFLAEISLCNDPGSEAYGTATCVQYRQDSSAGLGFGIFPVALFFIPPERPDICGLFPELCRTRLDEVWGGMGDAAEEFYDRTEDCSFTTFIAYEWSGSKSASNWHRNVIFATRTVPRVPTTFIEAYHPDQLWTQLERGCLDAGVGCDVLTIPHNGNISGGFMFDPNTEDGAPYDAAQAARRRALEPLVEIYQHKGASECTPAPGDPLGSEDAECSFELVVPDVCTGGPDDSPTCSPVCEQPMGGGFLGLCVAPMDFSRGALRRGLAEQARTGENPFAFGFIGSTDTHNATPGAVAENAWQGHVGNADDTPAERLEPSAPGRTLVDTIWSSAGGLAVLWAEENSRPSLFAAMRRREAYATSGSRIILRVFGGYGFSAELCGSPDLVAQGYANGVPMGGDLPTYPGSGAITLVISALRDSESAPLERVEVVKGWFDGVATHETVYEVAGGDNGAAVDLATCSPVGGGLDSACVVWTDPDFDASQAAFYYVRVLENPTCRWSQWECNRLAVDCGSTAPSDPYYSCCDPRVPKTIRERAWSSPIWYRP